MLNLDSGIKFVRGPYYLKAYYKHARLLYSVGRIAIDKERTITLSVATNGLRIDC